jgi:hypothetical protein
MKRAPLLLGFIVISATLWASTAPALASGSIVTRLSTDKAAVEVVSLPEGSGSIKVAIMKNLAGEGISYTTIPVTQKSYTPPPADPVVDMQAATSGGTGIGNWAGRLQTVPAPELKVSSVSPTSGTAAGGTSVTIKGNGFLTGATVKIGSAATSVVVVSETEITAHTAATAAGSYEVSVTDSKGTSTGGPTYTYNPLPPANTAPPTTTGTAQQGATLTEHHGTWTNSPTGYTYQWQQCSNLGEGCMSISGATGQTYVPVVGDVGHTIRVQETASNAGGSSSPAASSATAIVTSNSIVTRLSTDKAAVEVVSLPEGAGSIKVAIMKNLAGEGISYTTIPITQKSYTPPPADPVVDMQATTSGGTGIGNWAGRLQTVPASELKVASISPTSGVTTGGTPVTIKGSGFLTGATVKIGSAATSVVVVSETEITAHTAATAAGSYEVSVTDSKGTSTGGPSYTYAAPSEIVGVDAGGWNWEGAVNDFSGAVRYVRSAYQRYNDDTHMGYLAKDGVTLMPLFGEGGTLKSYDNATYVEEIVTWFKRYGKGGTFWAGKTDYGATTAEIINEPGNPYFYSDCCSKEGHEIYADITRKVHAALESNFTTAIRPKELVSYDGGYNGSEYGQAIFALGAVADGVTVHPYGGTANREKSGLGNRERVTQAHEQTGLPVYVTEVGWPTAVGKEPTGDSLQWTEAQQAENITNWVTWTRSLGYVAATVNFNYADYGTNDYYGIVNSEGTTHKLSYAALKAAAGL